MLDHGNLYLLIAAVGAVYLIGSLFLGGIFEFLEGLDADLDFDFEAGEPSFFSLKAIAAGAIGLGLVGYLSERADIPAILTFALAIVAFFVMLIASVFLVLRPLFRQQSNSQLSKQSYIGKTGLVIMSIGSGDWGIVRLRDDNNATVDVTAVSQGGLFSNLE